jgi:DNA phosphorothioation-dependent restriction protein DptG
MTQDEIMEMANKASKEWLKELPSPEETANQVPKRFLEIFAKLVAAKERNFCSRCGKRTADLTTIHTCTPPRGQA